MEAEHPELAEWDDVVEPPAVLALNVINARNARGMTQAQLAGAMGVSQPRIAKIELGDANPRLATLSKLAHALGLTMSELLENHLNPAREAAAVAARGRAGEARKAPARGAG